jgi:hypothetical protein
MPGSVIDAHARPEIEPMNRRLIAVAVCLASVWFPAAASAQVPFFPRGAGLFDPEISIVNSGVVSDVAATVSADRKYVTLTMRSSNSELVALREFAFQSGGGNNGNNNLPSGFAGDVAPALQRGNAAAPGRQPLPSDLRGGGGGPSILTREGMTLIATARGDAGKGAPPANAP